MVEENDSGVTRVLFCGPHFPASHIYTREYLQPYPFIQVHDVPLDTVPNVIADYHICVVKSQRLDAQLIARANKMKLIMQFGVGLEGVDVDAATRSGIKVARIPGNICGNSASCAEMAIYLILGLLRNQGEMKISIKQKKLGEPVGQTLLGKTVFIMGFGNIGIDLAKRLRPFGVRILATKRSWGPNLPDSCQQNGSFDRSQANNIELLVDKMGGLGDVYEFAKEADIVVICLLLNSETAGIVNNKFLSSMKKSCLGAPNLHATASPHSVASPYRPTCQASASCWAHPSYYHWTKASTLTTSPISFDRPATTPGAHLINIARGGLLDYNAVVHHLESGHLGGLGIDVAWTEPFDPNDKILKFQNVLITPHVAGVTEYSYRTMAKVVGDTALELHAGTTLTQVEFVN